MTVKLACEVETEVSAIAAGNHCKFLMNHGSREEAESLVKASSVSITHTQEILCWCDVGKFNLN